MKKNTQSFIDVILTAFVSFGVTREWDIRMGPGGIEARNITSQRYEYIRASGSADNFDLRGTAARGVEFSVVLGHDFGSLAPCVTSKVSWPSIGSVEPMDAAAFAAEITKMALLARVAAKALQPYVAAPPDVAEAFAHMAAHEDQTASAICD